MLDLYEFTLKRCWDIEKKEDIYVLSGSGKVRDLLNLMRDVELDFKALNLKYKELFDENGDIIDKKSGLYLAYEKELNPMNDYYSDVSNKIKSENLKYLATILPYFTTSNKYADVDDIEIDDIDYDTLIDFEKQLLKNLPIVFGTKKTMNEVADKKK